MKSGIFKIDLASVVDAVLTAVVAAVVVAFYGIVMTPGFDVFSADWTMIGKAMVNIAVISGVVSLGKDFISTNNGSLLGVGPTK